MKSEEIALPWFPISPDYIDQYHDSVLKYLRDVRKDGPQDLASDSSYLTTVGLLFQRAEQIAAEVCGSTLRAMERMERDTLELYVKIVASAACLCDGGKEEARLRYMAVLVYLLSILKPRFSDRLVPLYVKLLSAERVDGVGFTMDDVVDLNAASLVGAVEGASLTFPKEEKWFENHGTVRIGEDGVSVYGMNRLFLKMKTDGGAKFKSVLSAEDGAVQVLQDRKDRQEFSAEAFLADVAGVVPDTAEEKRRKRYQDGDALTVRVLNKGYDSIYAESTDPEYETVSAPVKILTASNVRGIYMTDVCRNISLNSYLNVTYRPDEDCFAVDDTIIDFIWKTFWENDEADRRYAKMNAILLFPCTDRVMNTWLTEYGFLVRTGYEPLERNAYRTLDITEYDGFHEYLRGTVSDGIPAGEPFGEKEARDGFMRLLLHSSERILTEAAPKKEVRLVDKDLVSLLHRILSARLGGPVPGSAARAAYIDLSIVLAAVAGDAPDLEYYRVSAAYLRSLVSFAQRRFKDIPGLDGRGLDDDSVRHMGTMVDILREYGRAEESEFLSGVIGSPDGTDLYDVAKLVQASNRFIGSRSLERLRDDLHREICILLGVSDAVAVPADADDDSSFPFPAEDDRIEHKMSWVYDNATGTPNETEQSLKILKTVCAFMNRYPEQGDSHLYIGTDEKRRYVNGIQADIDFLVGKGELTAKGDLKDEYCRHIMAAVKKRFPEHFQYVNPQFREEGQVLDLCVTPASQGVVYLNDVPYYRSFSSSIRMPDSIRQEISERKMLRRSDMADKVDAVYKAIQAGRCVVLKGYNSSNSNKEADRTVEAFDFVDNGRHDAIWAYDFSGTDRKNKVFLLRRATGVEVSPRAWAHKKLHQSHPLDMFGFYGDESIDFEMEVRTVRAKNLLVEQYPDTKNCLDVLPDGRWQVRGTLYNRLSLAAACGFYLSFPDDVDISKSQVFREFVSERLSHLIEKL